MSHSLDVESVNVDDKIIPSLNPQEHGRVPTSETSKGQFSNHGYNLEVVYRGSGLHGQQDTANFENDCLKRQAVEQRQIW